MGNTSEGLAQGYVQVYTGSGKGKTTAAFGLAVRAAGAGLRVYIAQFLKSWGSGEVAALARFSDLITIECFGNGRWPKRGDPEDERAVRAGWERACSALSGGRFDLVIFDEALGSARLELLSQQNLLHALDIRPPKTELILTGREAPAELIARADLVSEIQAVKHYYNAGVPARLGIEF